MTATVPTPASDTAFEQSKRRQRHPAALRAGIHREQARVDSTSTPYRKAEDAGQLSLFAEGEAASPSQDSHRLSEAM